MAKIHLPDGKYIFVPDGWSNAQIIEYANKLEQDEAETDILPALQRGFAKHAPDIMDLGAGAVGLAGDVTDLFGERKFEETEQTIRGKADEYREDLAGEAGRDVSDTFVEKIAEGIGGVPGMALSLAPAMAIPGAGLGTAAARFGAHGAIMAGGEGLKNVALGGAQGALVGGAFHGGGVLSGGIKNALGRRAAHAASTGTVASGIEFMTGVPAEDALASGIALGAIAGLGKNPYRMSSAEAKRVTQTKKLVEELRKDPANAGKNEVELYADAAERYGVVSARNPDEFELSKSKSNDPQVDELLIKELLSTTKRSVQTEGHQSILEHMKTPEGKTQWEGVRHADPWTFEMSAKAVQEMPQAQRQLLNEKWGKILDNHELTNIMSVKKYDMAAMSSDFQVVENAYLNHVAAGAPKAQVQEAKSLYENTIKEYTKTLADWEGLRSETGKALAWGNAAIRKSPIGERALHQAMRKQGGNPISPDMIKRILRNPDDHNAAHAVIKASSNPKFKDKLYEVWINGLLSGSPTHVVNSFSNGVVQLMGVGQRPITGALDAVLAKVEGRERTAYASDIFGDVYGAMRGMKAGWRDVKAVLGDETYKMEISSKLEQDGSMFNIGGATGKVVRAPSRMLRAMDLFFSAVGSQREGWATAHRLATKDIKAGKITKAQRTEHMQNTMKDPSAVLLERMNAAGKWAPMSLAARMEQAGRTEVFTSKPGKYTSAFQNFRRDIPGMRVIAPFVRTPANIMKFTLKRTPLGLITAGEKYMRYKRGELPAGPIVEEAAAALMGSAAMGTVLLMANEGLVTGGGPSDWTEQANLRETGWQPYSVWNPATGKWWSYARIEPLGTTFGMAADAAEIIRSGIDHSDPDIADKILAAFKDNITNKTFLTGLESLSQAYADPDMFGKAYLKTLLGSAVPNVLGQVSNMTDQYVRDARLDDENYGLLSPMAKRIPGLRKDLPIKHTPQGKPVMSPDKVGSGIFGGIARGMSPFNVSAPRPEAIVEMELAKLAQFTGVPPSMPSRKKQVDMGDGNPYGSKVHLTAGEYEVYHTYHQMANNQMAAFILSPGYSNMPPAQKAETLRGIYRRYQTAAGRDVDMRVRQRYGVQ